MKWLKLFRFRQPEPLKKNAPSIDAFRDRTPTNEQLIEQARHAEEASTAVNLWQLAIARKPESPTVWKEAVTALLKLKALDAADAVLCEAVKKFPDALELWYEWGRSAMARRLPIVEAVRWTQVRNQFPKHVHGYLCGARLARKQGQHIEAEHLIEEAIALIGTDKRLLLEHANCAEAQSNWPLAVSRWQALESAGPLDAASTASFAITLMRLGKLEDARERAQAGLNAFPADLALQQALAEIEAASGQHTEALKRWQTLRDAHPNNPGVISGHGQALWRYNLQNQKPASYALDRPVDVGLVSDATIRDLTLRFESLGQNCELGLVQRRYGAEPLGLLRWATTNPDELIAGLQRKFDGFGELENVRLDLEKTEIMVNEDLFKIFFHTFTQQSEALDLENFRIKQSRHLKFLARTFIDRLGDGDKIYVYRPDQIWSNQAYEEIYSELQKFGALNLLIVKRADQQHPANQVECVHDRLYFGYVERFGLDRGPVWDIAFDSWVALLRNAANLIDQQP